MKSPFKSFLPALKALSPADGKIWLVGGVLRDALLHRPLRDADMAVAGDARKMAGRLARAVRAKSFALDAGRGTYRVVAPMEGQRFVFDFSTLQGKTIEDDLSRRDFTMNAMALPLSHAARPHWQGHVLDVVGGKADIRAKRIRMVSAKALAEDPLRVLRAFRFAAELGFIIHKPTLAALRKNVRLVLKCAPERIREEIYRVLDTPKSAEVFSAMDQAGLLTVIFPEGRGMRETAHAYYGKEGVLGHSLAALRSFEWLQENLKFFFPGFHRGLSDYINQPVAGHPRYALLKLTEFLHDVGKPATAKVEDGKLHFYGHDYAGMKISRDIASRLRLSNEETKSLSRMVGAHMRPGNLGHQPVLTPRAVFRFYRDLESDALGMLLVSLADHFTYLSEKTKKARKDPVFLTIRRMLSDYFLKKETVAPIKVINGRDVMKSLRLPEGPAIGRILEAVQEAQAAGKVRNRQEALALAAEIRQKEPGAGG